MMTIRKVILQGLLIAVIMITALSRVAFAAKPGLMTDCVYSWDFGDDNKEVVVVRPLGEVCYQRCRGECQNFGLVLDENVSGNVEESAQTLEMHADLNKDLIDQCYLACQKGNIFKSKFRIPVTDRKSDQVFKWSDSVAETAAFCGGAQIAHADYAYFASGLNIDPTDTSCSSADRLSTCNNAILITLLNPPDAGGNMINLCGFATARIDPVTKSLVSSEWATNKWGNVLRNGVLPSIGEPPPAEWHARNPYWLDSGLDVKDGDFLSVKFGGNYLYGSNIGGLVHNLQVWMPGGNGAFAPTSTYETIPGNALQVAATTGNPSDKSVEYNSGIQSIVENNKAVRWKGLGVVYESNPEAGGWAQVWTENRPMPPGLLSSANPATIQIRDAVRNPNDSAKEMYRMQIFSGVLKGLSAKYMRLSFRHYDLNAAVNWNDNLGGMSILATWKGCIFTKGKRLQYAVVPTAAENQLYKPEALTDADWHDLAPAQMDGSSVFRAVGSAPGQIFFRINKLPSTYTTAESLAPICSNGSIPCTSTSQNVMQNGANKYARYNTGGQYMLTVEKTAYKSIIGGSIGWFVNEIYEYLFTYDLDDARKGIVPKMFKKFVATPSFVNAIRATLILYIAWTGLSYMIGLAKINQQDGIIRLLKISLVLIVISDTGFDVFNYYLFDAIKQGSMEMIIQIVTPIYEVSTGDHDTIKSGSIAEKILIIFSVFDRPFKTLFSDAIWYKVYALVLSGLLGVIVAITVIIASIVYVICIAKCTLIFLHFLIFTGLLMMLAPIFVTFILFKFTRQMFDNWIKALISFGLQPLFVFTSVALLNTLLMAALYTTLSFTACKMCFLGFVIPAIVDVCLIPGWVALITSHHPSTNAVAAPIANIPAAILLLIISQAFYVFCGFCASLAQTIATGSFFGVNFAQTAEASNPITAAQSVMSAIATGTGTDASSRNYHKGQDAEKAQQDAKKRDRLPNNLPRKQGEGSQIPPKTPVPPTS